jgi:hypothetical protein
MNERRITPLAGILSILLFVVAIVVNESGDRPDSDATGAEIASYLDGALGRLAISLVIWGVGTIALVWFLDGLREHVGRATEKLGRLSFFFGFGIALFMLASFVPEVAGALESDELDGALSAGAAQGIATLGDGFFFGAELLMVGFFLAAGLAAVLYRALPAWLGWLGLLLGAIALIPPIGWAVVIWGFPAWILLTSGALWLRRAPEAAA